MNLTKDTKILKYKNMTFIGEIHGNIKEKGLGKYIENLNEEIIILLECHQNINKISIGKIKKHYKNKIKINEQFKDDSYIDNVLYFFSKKSNILNRNKKLNEIIKKKKIKILCIDKRFANNYPKSQIRTLYKRDPEQIKNFEKELKKLKKKINKLNKSKSKTLLLKEIDDILDTKLKKNSSYLLQTLSEIILDYEIIKKIIKYNDKKIIGIFGKNHINNLKKKYLI
jgi:hypothetical protein